MNRDGKKLRVSAEFRSSDVLGLPSTADRDKYIGFMKLLMDMKLKTGLIQKPIRFSGYSLLKVLGQCDSGDNYEALNSWGQRMADRTITSEQVIYSSVRKRYMNKTVHVFRSFTRVGSSNLDNSDKVDTFEVELEDWLLENLNESFVVPEDFTRIASWFVRRPKHLRLFSSLVFRQQREGSREGLLRTVHTPECAGIRPCLQNPRNAPQIDPAVESRTPAQQHAGLA